MSNMNPITPAATCLPSPTVLAYESSDPPPTPGERPRWVYLIISIYGLAALAVLSAPAWLSIWSKQNYFVEAGIVVAGMTLCGLSLLILPVKMVRRRLIRRRSIWIPILISACLASLLVMAGLLAWAEYSRPKIANTEDFATSVEIGGAVVWLLWTSLFTTIAFTKGPQSIGMKLHRALITGSVLELLVAVPAHIVVRRRSECCAGILTGTAICVGAAVMFVAFGPSVLLLFWRRRKRQARPATASL